MAEIVTDNVMRMEVKRKKTRTGLFGTITRFFVGLTGAVIALFGGVLCLTIIGIPFGIGAILMGGGMFLGAFRRQQVECPACKKRVTVLMDAEDFECPRCKKAVILDWTE